ncbi:preprotein translocase subunit SecB [Salinimonas sp. HHU 13199]|uniref:Preprotein translocase subunit SecB n=1 Tax=Salinimonas profundi TaxID=2729140 RepID=A0ABR8LTG7_9ALTE|nr:preprotein translocase subunit SecB [Salinimonas profundi]MBD3587434.1 preprotein translocase subunit SecB [Salinimonas profundi]
MSQALKEAIKSLVIQDIYLRNSNTIVTDSFEPKYHEKQDSFGLQFKHLVEKAEVLELESDQGVQQNLLRVFLDVGFRLVDSEAPSEEGSEEEFYVQVEAQYVAEYTMKSELSKRAIDEFALENVSYHVWPFWREYISSQCTRINLPKIILPTKQLASNRQMTSCD